MIAATLTFLAAVTVVLAIGGSVGQSGRRLVAFFRYAGKSDQRLPAIARAAARLGAVLPLAWPRELEARIARAGLTGAPGIDARSVMSAKAGLCVAAAGAGLAVAALLPGRIGLLAMVGAPVAGFMAPDLWLRRAELVRTARIRRELPATLDLLRVTTSAGASLPGALRQVGDGSAGVLARELRAVAVEVALGVPLERALDGLSGRAWCAEVDALAAALRRASRHGAPLAETLAAQAKAARERRVVRVREEAARAGPKIQLVVALLLVPSVLLMVGAALARAFVSPGMPLQLL